MSPHLAYVSVGSNMGDRLANCRNGLAAVDSAGAGILRSRSLFYATEPVDFTDQAWFVNGVGLFETDLAPAALLGVLQRIQREAGRTDGGVRFGPRILDLDILLYDDWVMDTPALVIPHPRMHLRRFVLKPLCDINAAMVHPVLNQTMNQLLAGLTEAGQAVVPAQEGGSP